MNNPIVALTKILPALAMACALAAITAEPAAAQTANKLKCTGCIKSKQVKNEALTGADIKNGTVGGADLANNSVNSAKIANGSVGAADLGANSVNGAKIADGTVGNADLANDAVDSSKVQDNSLTAGDLAANSVGASELGNNAVGSANVIDNSLTSADLGTNSVTASEIATNAVGAAEIGANAVGGSEVAPNSISSGDLSNEPGAEFAFDTSGTITSTASAQVTNLPITTPGSGVVVVTASGSFFSTVSTTITCSLGTGTTVIATDDMTTVIGPSGRIPFSRTQAFSVGTGSITYRLVCQRTGATGTVSADDMHIVAMFFPTRY